MLWASSKKEGTQSRPLPRGMLSPGSRPTARHKVSIQKIARGFAGKTLLDMAICEAIADFGLLGSLQIDVADPLAVAGMIEKQRAELRQIASDSAPPTTNEETMEYAVFAGERKIIDVATQEVIGQILEHTTRDSAPEQLSKQKAYVNRLADAD